MHYFLRQKNSSTVGNQSHTTKKELPLVIQKSLASPLGWKTRDKLVIKIYTNFLIMMKIKL